MDGELGITEHGTRPYELRVEISRQGELNVTNLAGAGVLHKPVLHFYALDTDLDVLRHHKQSVLHRDDSLLDLDADAVARDVAFAILHLLIVVIDASSYRLINDFRERLERFNTL